MYLHFMSNMCSSRQIRFRVLTILLIRLAADAAHSCQSNIDLSKMLYPASQTTFQLIATLLSSFALMANTLSSVFSMYSFTKE